MRRFGGGVSAGEVVTLDLGGERVELSEEDGARLRAAALAEAGTSSVARDLALLLDRAGKVLALRRVEAHVLARIAAQAGMTALARRLA